MTLLMAALSAGLAIAGVFLLVIGLLPRRATEPGAPAPPSRGPLARLSTGWRGLAPGRRRLLAVALIAGAGVAAVTAWLPALVIVPLAILVGPVLLSDPPNRDIEVLEALDRWVRSLVASLLTGKSVPDAIRSTRRQAPPCIAPAVELAAARLTERWPLPEAMAALADDIDHADADAVAAALIVAGQRGTAASATLEALADAVQDRLAAARDIENERAKPRIVVRQVTIITGVALGLALITSPAYFAPYRAGLGPLIATVLALVYVGALVRLQAASRPPPRARVRPTGTSARDRPLETGGDAVTPFGLARGQP